MRAEREQRSEPGSGEASLSSRGPGQLRPLRGLSFRDDGWKAWLAGMTLYGDGPSVDFPADVAGRRGYHWRAEA
jgi:hypothetical protein